MKYFETYTSNTIAGSANQFFFDSEDEFYTGRVFYKITVGGKYDYSFLFSNIIDSTYSDGSVSAKNRICSSWELKSARVAICSSDFFDNAIPDNAGDFIEKITGFYDLTFDGKTSKTVMPGEFFTTDALPLDIQKGEYICMEITCKGKMIPFHPESQLPVYRKMDGIWKFNKKMPLAGMVGANRIVKKKLAFLGDSITQGIGAGINTYKHWNALLANAIGDEYACWNLGIGYGRANDAASDGAWLYKAKQNDYVVVCYGVNDINKGHSADQIKKDLGDIIDKLHATGAKVLLHTVPPYYYENGCLEIWHEVNDYIINELSKKADAFFDIVPHLLNPESPYGASKFGGHPNADGSKIWADALLPELIKFIEA